jgi:GT2 family glycosyltransferase
LDDDAWFLRDDAIALALKTFQQHASLAAVGFDMASPDKPEIAAFAEAEPAGMFTGCGHILRVEALRKIGLYEPMPGMYGSEEKDLCLRLMDAGYWVARLPGVGVWHDKTPLARDIPFQHKSGVCNDLVMTMRRSPWFLLPALLPLKAWRHLTFAWRNDLLAPCLSGMALFTRSIGDIRAYRKPVRAETLLRYLRLSRPGTS